MLNLVTSLSEGVIPVNLKINTTVIANPNVVNTLKNVNSEY